MYLASALFSIPNDAVMLDPTSQMHLLVRRAAPVHWHIALEDLRGRVFETLEVPLRYSLRAA